VVQSCWNWALCDAIINDEKHFCTNPPVIHLKFRGNWCHRCKKHQPEPEYLYIYEDVLSNPEAVVFQILES